jgi:hypothetical protein
MLVILHLLATLVSSRFRAQRPTRSEEPYSPTLAEDRLEYSQRALRVALSRRKQGFESPRERHLGNQTIDF